MTSFPRRNKEEDKGVQDEGVKEAQKRAAPNRAPGTVENRHNEGGWEERRHCDRKEE